MNERSEMTANTRDWLDDVLADQGRQHRAGYLPDDGFTARVVSALPAPATLPAWRKPAITAMWAVAGIGAAFALPGAVSGAAVDVLREMLRVVAGPVSLVQIAGGVGLLGVATWLAAYYALRQD